MLIDKSPPPSQSLSDPGLPAIFMGADSHALRACKILIIDDEEANVLLLERVLARAGFDNFISTRDSTEAVALFEDFQPDLVLTDWLMPGVDGCAVVEQLRALTASDDYLPIVVLTADITPEAKKRALAAGATDFLTKPFDQTEVLLRIRNVLKSRLSHLVVQTQTASLEESVRLRTVELERALIELKGTQRQVIQQERLAALGTMAGGIAHDFNNALSIIMGFGEMLLEDLGRGLTRENATLPITTILTAAEDAATIVHRLREFYRPDESAEHRVPIDLNEIVEQSISLTQPRWQTGSNADGRTITVTTDLRDIPNISGDATELREVLTNLVFNAVDAMPKGGTISLGTFLEGETVAVRISDTGIGMSEEVRQRCLEPFFSTKGKTGTGLGLSMAFGIISRHGGAIDIESEPGKGASFVLRLPASTAKIETRTDAPPWTNAPLRVLVVDDQPVLCQLMCDQLQDDLHSVETAFNGSDALKKFSASQFDLVITDHVMTEMNGEQLAIRIKELSPKVPVILLTGYQTNSAAGKQYSHAIDLVLEKPLSRVALRNAFARVMAAA
jgi:signal transduction histidine kinase